MNLAGHAFDRTILREYDIRGTVGDTLGEADARAVGLAFGTVVRLEKGKGARICVAFDGRDSSPVLVRALIEGLAGTGARVLRVGRGPTPLLYFAVFHLDADAGVMVTGSHNPREQNGFKLMLGRRSFFGTDIVALGMRAASGDYAAGEGSVSEVAVREQYVAGLATEWRESAGAVRRVAWDVGNGAAGDVLPSLVAKLPGEHLLLNVTVDGAFPNHHPDPTVPENLVQLQSAVAEERCDLGVALDGDGDRIGAVDSSGRIVWPDQLLAVLAREVLEASPGALVIGDVKCSQVLFDEIARLGGRPMIWKTGHSLIKTKMAEEGAPLAGEMSGHIFFADRYFGYDDALYAAVRLLSYLDSTGQSLAAILDALPTAVNTPELRIPCAEDRKFAVVEELRERLRRQGAEVSSIDGVRVTTDDGWWLVRASNTQAVLVARAEARDDSALHRICMALEANLAESGVRSPGLRRP